LRHASKPRSSYRKSEDAELLEPVRRLVDERPTYDYRRIGALLNRERLQSGLSRLNHKRIYRLMAQNGLLLQRYTGKVPGRVHEGRIITIRPNLRWTSDTFEVACWNDEVLRVRDRGRGECRKIHIESIRGYAAERCAARTGHTLAVPAPLTGTEAVRANILADMRSHLRQTPRPLLKDLKHVMADENTVPVFLSMRVKCWCGYASDQDFLLDMPHDKAQSMQASELAACPDCGAPIRIHLKRTSTAFEFSQGASR